MFLFSPIAASTAQAQGSTPLLTIPLNITQTVNNNVLNFVGNLNVTRFINQGGQLVAVGNVVGTLTNQTTGVITQIVQSFRQVVAIIARRKPRARFSIWKSGLLTSTYWVWWYMLIAL